MTKFLTCLLAISLMAGLATAQTDIDDIQVYNAAGEPASPYDGQTVTIEGVVYVPAGIYNNGTHYILDATGGISFFQAGTGLALGDEVSVTGTVDVYSGEIQIANPSITYLGSPGEPTPTPATTGELANDYERVGDFVSVIGEVTSKSSSQFELATVGEDTMIVYIDSTTGIDLGAVAVGDEYQVTSPVVVFNTPDRAQAPLPERPGRGPHGRHPARDRGPPPWTTTWSCPPAPPTFSATITDNSAVASATLYYRESDGETAGSWMSMSMSNLGGDTYGATLPAGFANSQIDYYFSATDDGAQTVTLPGDAPAGFFEVAVGLTSIYEMQYVHPDSANGDTPFLDKVLNIQGIVTAGTGEVGSPSKFIVQEAE